jgi:hypothetical protein
MLLVPPISLLLVALIDTNRPAARVTASGCAANNACRHVYSCPLLMPYWRATSVGDAPGARLCAAIVCFCSIVHRRRRSPRVINSIRGLRALLRLLV